MVASRIAADSLRLLPRKRLSRALGRVADLGGPPAVVKRAVDTFVKVYGVDLSEADVPREGWRSFNEFFTRRLVAGARPLDADPLAILSPSDGRLDDAGPIDAGATFRVKGRLYEVGELLGDAEEARRFDGGSFWLVYLAPPDYHRVHAPVSGRVVRARHVPGTLFPVNAIGTTHIPRLFARNERIAVFQESETHGLVATVLVGAIGVGRIGISFDDLETNVGRSGGARHYDGSAPVLERGDELGVFNLGSTVLVFTPPGERFELVKRAGDRVRMGEALARKVGA